MLGKIIGVVCFACAALVLILTPLGVYAAASLFISGAVFWMLGVYQTSLEKIEYYAEWQKNLSEKGSTQNKRIIYLLEKIAGEEHQGESVPAEKVEQIKVAPIAPTMMPCPQCGTEINRLATICPKCKTKFKGGEPILSEAGPQ